MARYRRRKSSNLPMIAALLFAVSVIGAGAFGVIVLVGSEPLRLREAVAKNKPETPKTDYSQWTHTELLAHFKSKGAECVWKTSSTGRVKAIAIMLKTTYAELNFNEAGEEKYFNSGMIWLDDIGSNMTNNWGTRVYLCESEKEAMEMSGSIPNSRFWCRFVFKGRKKDTDMFASLLPKN